MLKKIIKRTSIAFILLITLLLLTYLLLKDNIHTVISKQVYRSAQLKPAELKVLVKEHHIKSVINLRGANPDKQWYREEMVTSKALGARHYNVRLGGYQLPTPKRLRKLVSVLQAAPRPVLIHCEGGADRTGLASAIILILKGDSLIKAKEQISIRYFSYSPKSIGRLVMPFYTRWLKKKHLRSSTSNFLKWVGETRL